MLDAGYSGTPLAKKLGLKPGQAAAFVALPDSLDALAQAEAFARLARVKTAAELDGGYDLVHAFFRSLADLKTAMPVLKAAIRPAGMIWISWPKKAAKLATDVSENLIRDCALDAGLVDVKVCAVDEVWSGLKLVIPIAARPPLH